MADENFPRVAVGVLQAIGHDVLWIRLAAPGAADTEVLAVAIRERRILLTFDNDFDELAGRSAMPPGSGIILFRIPAPRSEAAARRLAAQISARDDWSDCFSVVEAGRVRMRRYR